VWNDELGGFGCSETDVANVIVESRLESGPTICFELIKRDFVDNVYEVRRESCRRIAYLLEEYGFDWAQQNTFDGAIGSYKTSTNYLHRMISLFFIEDIIDKITFDQIKTYCWPTLEPALNDHVSNVRFTASKTAKFIIPHLPMEFVLSHIKPLLDPMTENDDTDVSYFAMKALEQCEMSKNNVD
jgi:serine/threonine-protein phosphatase 2A regulatory subunit A